MWRKSRFFQNPKYFPLLEKITVFSKSQIFPTFGENHGFFKIPNFPTLEKSRFFQNPEFSHFGQIPDISHFGEIPVLSHFGQIPDISHFGQIPDISHFGQIPDISHFYRIPCIFQNFRVFKKFPVQSSFIIPRLTTYKKAVFRTKSRFSTMKYDPNT